MKLTKVSKTGVITFISVALIGGFIVVTQLEPTKDDPKTVQEIVKPDLPETGIQGQGIDPNTNDVLLTFESGQVIHYTSAELKDFCGFGGDVQETINADIRSKFQGGEDDDIRSVYVEFDKSCNPVQICTGNCP